MCVSNDVPAEFAEALADLRAQGARPGVHVEEIAAPVRVAPYSAAFAGEVTGEDAGADDDPVATGRFVVLHDPAGQESWQGTFRIVTLVRATLEPEMAADPLLAEVAWSWIPECLQLAGLRPGSDAVAEGGTVTRVMSKSFGALSNTPDAVDLELRASWTPADTRLGAHLQAWTALLSTAAGAPPLPAGVTALNRRFTDRPPRPHTVGP
ncbi:DUF3000 domain-containing protein [Myceligenerans salitolerans]|uniref:DUF3000 domain-containing protein n=1 Tax=Myceligenerans salitolerans TaxID=1230528 RepID=A0ABS3IF37_9MICO|nr:DUF3000 domain-containing protein [Myceligenerans salitolerans]